MAKQFRVSWEMWPHEWPRAHRTEKIHDDESEARSHLAGLKSMEAPHEPRPCGDHVWSIKFEERDTNEWADA